MDQELFLKSKVEYRCRETKTIVGIANALAYGKQDAEIVVERFKSQTAGLMYIFTINGKYTFVYYAAKGTPEREKYCLYDDDEYECSGGYQDVLRSFNNLFNDRVAIKK
ncbi:hypothetical protein HOS79_gp009 [Lactobacillus phage Nyseid]|uniref:Uncharacterized protein n=1 Tax=Lactobacillus phage Nyseid TaxID=2079432 RepID=A0A2K9VC35_9CAUD|nr:hypothetical protein HOS79_gp009 [Lactobacillus phage Nyseid]AUV59769.1 hypothetical protein [Lactobacillus phage Nyseid]